MLACIAYDKLATSPRAVGARTVEPLNSLESTEIGNPTEPANQDESMMEGLLPDKEQVNALGTVKPQKQQRFCYERYGETEKCSKQECTFTHNRKEARAETDYRVRRAINQYDNHHTEEESKMLREEWSSGAIKA